MDAKTKTVRPTLPGLFLQVLGSHPPDFILVFDGFIPTYLGPFMWDDTVDLWQFATATSYIDIKAGELTRVVTLSPEQLDLVRRDAQRIYDELNRYYKEPIARRVADLLDPFLVQPIKRFPCVDVRRSE